MKNFKNITSHRFGLLRKSISIILILLSASSILGQNLSTKVDDATDPLINQGLKIEAIGSEVMVSTQVAAVSEAAVEVMRNGGNAFDAFITAVLMQIVMEPHMVSHWGIMTGVIYDAKKDEFFAFDGTGGRPLASRSTKGDPLKVSIGGTIKALGSIWERYGTKSWSSYFGSAIKAAEEGVLVTPYMYSIIYAAWENPADMWPEGVRDLINNKEARDFYMPDGFLVTPGKRWKMPALAKHLKRLAKEGADYMYTGDWAKKFVRESIKLGGRVSMEDLAEYKIKWRKPTHFNYNGYEIISESGPVVGGLIIGTNLNILDNFDLKSMGHYTESADALEIMLAASDRTFFEANRMKDPDNYYLPEEVLLSDDYGKMMAKIIKNSRLRPGIDLAPSSKETKKKTQESMLAINDKLKESGHSHDSNHNTMVDKDGNWISSLHSGHGGTPGYFFDGVEANGSTVPSDVMGPGRRQITPLCATMVLKNGKPWLALGTPGYPPQPITEVLVNILEYGINPKEAVEMTRFWQPDEFGKSFRIESRISDQLKKDMTSKGYNLIQLKEYDWHLGSIQLIWKDDSGKLHGITDPRRLGYAAGF